ncbi:hypothetical protein L083_3743 [Actinoplanes sp. N902-109]|nr:hypothetical protein L083_3743 [Actinoplanes sp. N902-109]
MGFAGPYAAGAREKRGPTIMALDDVDRRGLGRSAAKAR